VRVRVGRVADVSDAECVAVGDGRAVVVRVGDRLVAYRNRCLHQDSPLDGGWVREGVLSCPLHFWRYRVADGSHVGSGEALETFPVEVVDGEAFVVVPDDPEPVSLREQLLARARDYDRDRAWADEHG
jgi:nitrite reductase/ring-hydroxylating ferredoxin subunit